MLDNHEKIESTKVKSGSQKMQASMVRRWLHELEPVNHLENLGPPRSLCLFPTNSKPENIRCRRNTEDTRRVSFASSQAARPLGRTATALALEWTSRTPRVANVRHRPAQVRQLSEQEGEQTQASLGAAYMGLISGAHLRGMNWRGL